MRELTYQEVDELSGGNPIVLGLGLGMAIGGVSAGLDYSLNSTSFSALGLTLAVTQGGMVGVLTTGGTILLGVPGGAAADRFVRRVGDGAAGIAGGHFMHALQLLKGRLQAPETAACQGCDLSVHTRDFFRFDQ